MVRKGAEKKRIWLSVSAVVILALLLLSGYLLWRGRYPQERRADEQRLRREAYDSVYLSMYPIDHFREEDYSHYRGFTTVLTEYEIPDLKTLEEYMKVIAGSGNTIHTVYLGIIPGSIDVLSLKALMAGYPGVSFEIVPAYPPGEWWKELSAEEYRERLQDYEELVRELTETESAAVYLFSGKEWLICNRANYTENGAVNTEIAQTIMLHSDRGHSYVVNEENRESFLTELAGITEEIRQGGEEYPDLSGSTIVFFGDSIVGNYYNTASIPGVVGSLTGGAAYNLGFGGKSAAKNEKEPFSFEELATAFVNKDADGLPQDKQIYRGIQQYIADRPGEEELIFVVSFGLNDYFTGVPVNGEDPYDTAAFTGALRSGVRVLTEAYPQAQILLCTPTFSTYFENGTQRQGAGGTLTEYVDAVKLLAQELGTEVLDGYHSFGIDEENQAQYLEDGCHFNEAGRFLAGKRIARTLSFCAFQKSAVVIE